jgi:hypothetical protein
MNEQNVEVIQKTSQEETIIRKEIKKKNPSTDNTTVTIPTSPLRLQ